MSTCAINQLLRALMAALVVSIVAGQCLTKQQFSSYKDNHQYSVANVRKDWSSPTGPYKMIVGGGGPSLTRIDNGAIRGSFRKGKIKGYDTGFSWYSKHAKGHDEASMAYRVKFSAGFDWTKGGKLPGLCGGEGRGTVCPAGCSPVGRDRGFSMRLMWRQNGGAVTYAYYPDKPKSIRCGEDWKWSQGFKANKWHHIRMWAKLNTGSNKNGEFKAWLDGKQVLHRKGIRYRYNTKFDISRSYITTYAGGSSVAMFAPKKDQYIWFDDFESWVGGGKSPCGLKSSNTSPRNPPPRNPPPASRPPAATPPPDEQCPSGCIIDPSPPQPQGAPKQRGVGTQKAPKGCIPFTLELSLRSVLLPRRTGVAGGHDVHRTLFNNNPSRCTDISGYALVLEEAGWDVIGNVGRRQAPRGSLLNAIKFCIRACDKEQKCAGFGLNSGVCWLKSEKLLSQEYVWHGKKASGWRWLYRSKAKTDPRVTDQSVAAGESEMLEFKTYTMLDGGTCGAIMPPADESQCDWVITAVWPQVVDGQRLKIWGLELIEQQELGATFRMLSGDMGLCLYWQDFDGSVNPQVVAQWLQLSAACPE